MQDKARKYRLLGLIFFLLNFFLLQNHSYAQVYSQDFVIGKAIKIRSQVLNEERSLLIYLPDGYNKTQIKYPVLYVLDGDGHFHHVTGIVQFLSTRKLIPPMIVIAIPNIDRNRDFTPTQTKRRSTSGGADKFIKFLNDELISYVDKNYRTYPYRILVGHSLGGLFSLYTLLTTPDTFNAYIAISPGIGYDNEYLIKEYVTILENMPTLKKFLFMTLGNESSYIPRLEAFCKTLEDKAPKDLEWKYTYMEKEDHYSIVHRSVYNGLESLYSTWKVTNNLIESGIEAIQEHYKALSERFGYEIPVPALVYNLVGYRLIQAKDIDKAIRIFRLCIEAYPEYWYAYSNLGYCFMVKGNKELAVENLEKALKLNPNDKLTAQRLKKLKEEK